MRSRRNATSPSQPNGTMGPGTAVYVPTPPPDGPAETAPTPARGDQAWVPGHYSWNAAQGQWTRVNGSWQQPPSPGATWVPGTYDQGSHRWTEGYWNSTGARR